MVIGASSFIGSSLGAYLFTKNQKVVATEDLANVDVDELPWSRVEHLRVLGLPVEYVNLSNVCTVRQLLGKYIINNLIYVPSDLYDGHLVSHKNLPLKSGHASSLLKHFVILLDELSTLSKNTRVILLSISQSHTTPSIQIVWAKLFERLLAAYKKAYNLKTAIIRLGSIYGEWQASYSNTKSKFTAATMPECWYIGDIDKQFYQVLTQGTEGEIGLGSCDLKPSTDNRQKVVEWHEQYTQSLLVPRKDVVMTTYFTTIYDPHMSKTLQNVQVRYFLDWFLSLKRLGMNIVIFHDNLSNGVQDRIRKIYSNVDFVLCERKQLLGRSPNDKRYYLYLDYLMHHNDIGRVVMTDARDVKLYRNVFELIGLFGDHLYIGEDDPFYKDTESNVWVRNWLNRCYPSASYEIRHLETLYNAGVLGGSRQKMITVLTMIVKYLDIMDHGKNCNMAIFNYVVHRYFFDRVITGYPFNSGFFLKIPGPNGVYIRHKWEY